MGGELVLLQGEFVLSHGEQIWKEKRGTKKPPDMGGLANSMGEPALKPG